MPLSSLTSFICPRFSSLLILSLSSTLTLSHSHTLAPSASFYLLHTDALVSSSKHAHRYARRQVLDLQTLTHTHTHTKAYTDNDTRTIRTGGNGRRQEADVQCMFVCVRQGMCRAQCSRSIGTKGRVSDGHRQSVHTDMMREEGRRIGTSAYPYTHAHTHMLFSDSSLSLSFLSIMPPHVSRKFAEREAIRSRG